MIIKIEDAPAVKHITIDIDFTGEGESITVTKGEASEIPNFKLPSRDDSLDLDEDFSQSEEEVIIKPDIGGEEREVKVSEEMQNAEF